MTWLRHPLRSIRRASRLATTLVGEGQYEIRADAQSLGFAVDLCHVLQREWGHLNADTRMTLLDMGARSATGSNLIAQSFHPHSWSRLKLEVTALDIEPIYAAGAHDRFPDVDYRVGDVLDLEGQWDIVTCSHTLEHLTDPRPVMRKLLALARKQVVIAAPWTEPTASRADGHLFTFDEHFFEDFPATHFEAYRSPHWHDSECFIASYTLRADRA